MHLLNLPRILKELASLFDYVQSGFDNLCTAMAVSGPRFTVRILAAVLLAQYPSALQAQTKPDKNYLVYVVSEAADKIAVIRYRPCQTDVCTAPACSHEFNPALLQ